MKQLDSVLAGITKITPSKRQEFQDILDLWCNDELTSSEAVQSFVDGHLIAKHKAEDLVLEWEILADKNI